MNVRLFRVQENFHPPFVPRSQGPAGAGWAAPGGADSLGAGGQEPCRSGQGAVPCPGGGFHGHGGTPLSLDGF